MLVQDLSFAADLNLNVDQKFFSESFYLAIGLLDEKKVIGFRRMQNL